MCIAVQGQHSDTLLVTWCYCYDCLVCLINNLVNVLHMLQYVLSNEQNVYMLLTLMLIITLAMNPTIWT